MFGEESAKAEQERRARQIQYAADLRQQIEDNENTRKTFQSSASKHILNLNSNVNQQIPKNSSWAPSQYLGLKDTPDEPSKQTLNDNTPSYSARPSFNVKQIAEDQMHAAVVSSDIKPKTYSNNNNLTYNTNGYNNSSSYNNNNFNNTNANNTNNFNLKIQSQIQSLKNTIDRITSVEIPMRMKSNDEAISSLSSKIENAIQLSRESNQTIRDKMAELSFNYNQVNQKSLDHSEKLRSTVSELRNDFSRSSEATNSRFTAIESRLDLIESSIRSISSKQQQVERLLAEQSSALSKAISTVEKNSNSGDQNIMSQLESLNNKTISTFAQVNQAIKNSTTGLNESINALVKDVRESFKLIRNETDNEISQIRSQNDNSMNDLAKSFSSLQDEVLSTITTFRGHMNDNLKSFQDAFAAEAKLRTESDQKLSSNQKEIAAKLIEQHESIQKTINNLDEFVQPTVNQLCNSYFTKWRNELSTFVNGVLNSFDGLQTKINENEKKFTDFASLQTKTNNDVIEQLTTESQAKEQMGTEISGIKNQINEEINKIDNRFGQIDTKFGQTDDKIVQFDEKFKQNDQKLGQINTKLKQNDQKIVLFNNKFKQNDEKVALFDNKFRQNDEIIGQFNDRFKLNDEKIGQIGSEIGQIDTKINLTDEKIGLVDARLGQFDENCQQQIREVNDTITSRYDTLQSKHKKNKLKLMQALDHSQLESRLDSIEQDISSNLKAKINLLEAKTGPTNATTPINERLDSTIGKLASLRSKMENDLTNRLQQIEAVSSNQSIINERIARLEQIINQISFSNSQCRESQMTSNNNTNQDSATSTFRSNIFQTDEYNDQEDESTFNLQLNRLNAQKEMNENLILNQSKSNRKPNQPSGSSTHHRRHRKKADNK